MFTYVGTFKDKKQSQWSNSCAGTSDRHTTFFKSFGYGPGNSDQMLDTCSDYCANDVSGVVRSGGTYIGNPPDGVLTQEDAAACAAKCDADATCVGIETNGELCKLVLQEIDWDAEQNLRPKATFVLCKRMAPPAPTGHKLGQRMKREDRAPSMALDGERTQRTTKEGGSGWIGGRPRSLRLMIHRRAEVWAPIWCARPSALALVSVGLAA
eukprot:g19248.t1